MKHPTTLQIILVAALLLSACAGQSAAVAPEVPDDTSSSAASLPLPPTEVPVVFSPTTIPINTETPRFSGVRVILTIWDDPTSDGHVTIHGIKAHLTIIDTATGSIADQEYLKVILNGQTPPYLYDNYATGELYLDFPSGVGLESLEVQFLNKCNMLIDKNEFGSVIVPTSDGETHEYTCSY